VNEAPHLPHGDRGDNPGPGGLKRKETGVEIKAAIKEMRALLIGDTTGEK
jgi:hypothetical protein